MDESQKTLQRLERLRQLNIDREWVNTNLYRLMYKEDLYILAYERIKSAPGNLTPGSDKQTIDGFSLNAIHAGTSTASFRRKGTGEPRDAKVSCGVREGGNEKGP